MALAKSFSVPFTPVRVNGSIDAPATCDAALEAARQFINGKLREDLLVAKEEEDRNMAETSALLQKLLSEGPLLTEVRIHASTLANMAIGSLKALPTPAAMKDFGERFDKVLRSQPGEYLHVQAGPNAGFWIRSRTEPAKLATLVKSV